MARTAATLFLTIAFLGIFPALALAQPDGGEFASTLVNTFYNKTQSWEPTLQRYALELLKWIVTLEVCWMGIRAALNRDNLPELFKQFVLLIISACFFAAVIDNYSAWSWQIINGLKKVGVELSVSNYSSDTPFIVGLRIIKLCLVKISAFSPANAVGLLFCALVVVICFALITAQAIMIKCEVVVSLMAAMVLLGLGGSSITRDYATNAVRYVVSVAMKLFVLQLVLGIGIAFIVDLSTSTGDLGDVLVIIGSSIILLAMVKSLPDMVSGIVQGAHVGGGNLVGTAGSLGAAVLGAGKLGMSAGHGVMALKTAASLTKAEGKSGLGRMAGTVGHMLDARRAAKTPEETSLNARTNSEMKSRLAQQQMKGKS